MQSQNNDQQREAYTQLIYFTEVDKIKKNDYAVLCSIPCRVTETYSIGLKVEFPNYFIVGCDIFTGKKYEQKFKNKDLVEVPIVQYSEYLLIDISDDDYLTLLLNYGQIKEDVKLPQEEPQLVEKLKADFQSQKEILITIFSALGKEKIVSYKLTNV
ncbi:hypothetical protein ABPG72_011135 [Tetrahymena utriculariae]